MKRSRALELMVMASAGAMVGILPSTSAQPVTPKYDRGIRIPYTLENRLNIQTQGHLTYSHTDHEYQIITTAGRVGREVVIEGGILRSENSTVLVPERMDITKSWNKYATLWIGQPESTYTYDDEELDTHHIAPDVLSALLMAHTHNQAIPFLNIGDKLTKEHLIPGTDDTARTYTATSDRIGHFSNTITVLDSYAYDNILFPTHAQADQYRVNFFTRIRGLEAVAGEPQQLPLDE